MIQRFISFTAAFAFFAYQLHSQRITETAKEWIKILTSDSLHGRGYVNEGHYKAARFIAEKFSEFSLVPAGRSYFQFFPVTVNLFSDTPTLKIGEKILAPGEDFIPHPSSGSGGGESVLHDLSYGQHLTAKNCRNRFLFIRDGLPDSLKGNENFPAETGTMRYKIEQAEKFRAKGIIFVTHKLTFGYSQERARIPVFIVTDIRISNGTIKGI